MKEFDGVISEYVQGYRDGYQNGYATALRDIIKKSEQAEIPKPIEIWYNTENRSDKSDVIIDNALCPTCGAEANAACKGCED